MLRIANGLGLKITKPRSYITPSFRFDSYERVRDFSFEHPEYVALWMGLGLSDPTEDEFS